MGFPLIGAAIGAGLRFVGQRAAQAGAQQLTRQGVQNQVAKQTFLGTTGLGVMNASPAQAPGMTSPDRAQISPEASSPEAPPQIPDFSGLFNGAP